MSTNQSPKLLYVSIFQEFSGPKAKTEVFLSHLRYDDDSDAWEANKVQVSFPEWKDHNTGIHVLSNILGKVGVTVIRD